MDKQAEAQADSLSTVTVKEYPPSEGFGSEAPPAYQKLRSSSVQIARLAAITIVVSSFVLGSFILAAAWIEANASCHVQDFYDQPEHYLQPQALTQDAADLSEQPSNHVDEPLSTEESSAENQNQNQNQNQHQQEEEDQPSPSKSTDDLPADEHTPVRVRLPLQLDFDDIAGMLVQKNQRSRMNCVVEKKRAEEIVDHQPRTLKLPFGVNLTTDPRYEHVSGERMAISCESGDDQGHAPMDAAMRGPGPVVIPLPGPVHLPLQFHGAMLQQQLLQRLRAQQHQLHQLQVLEQLRAQQAAHAPIHVQHVQHVPVPMVVPVQMQASMHVVEQPEQQHERQKVQFPGPQQARSLPPHVLQQLQMQEARRRGGRVFPGIEVVELREEVSAPFPPPPAPHQQQQQMQQQQQQQVPVEVMEVVREGRGFQQQPEGARDFHRLPMHLPVPMAHQQPPPRPAEEPRPHYVQPRSVRSVDDVLHRREKRMRRCACDCAC